MEYSKDLYNDAVIMARYEADHERGKIPWWNPKRTIERQAYDAFIELLDHVQKVDPEHAMSDIVKLAIQTKLIFDDGGPIHDIVMRMMVDIGKKMGPGEVFGFDLDFN